MTRSEGHIARDMVVRFLDRHHDDCDPAAIQYFDALEKLASAAISHRSAYSGCYVFAPTRSAFVVVVAGPKSLAIYGRKGLHEVILNTSLRELEVAASLSEALVLGSHRAATA